MEFFKASVQYGDWHGTVAADDAGANAGIQKYLKDQGLVEPSDFVIAVSFYTGEHDFTSIAALVYKNADNFEPVKAAIDSTDGPLPVRRVHVKLTPTEFLALFKRFNVMLTWHSFELEGREYDAEDE